MTNGAALLPYPASRIRRRATPDEMEVRAAFLIGYAQRHRPVTVRQLYYAAETHGVPGIGKDERDYEKVQQHVLKLRRQGRLPYRDIADLTRWQRKPVSFYSVEDALEQTAKLYRRNLWHDVGMLVEVWLDKDALAGAVYPVTSEYDVPLMVYRGFSSETFAWEAVQSYADEKRPVVILHVGDFDRAGEDARRDLERKLTGFAGAVGLDIHFLHLGVTLEQIAALGLSRRLPKRSTAADQRWPYDFAVELDAIPPDTLRDIVRAAIEEFLPPEQLAVLKAAEQSERLLLQRWAGGAR
jgi:hypothetical protein